MTESMTPRVPVFLGLGSNTDAPRHIRFALDGLREAFGNLAVSPVYESEAVGFAGNNFLNLVVQLVTDLSVGELLVRLRDLENRSGRDRTQPKFSGRTLDIDILLYGDRVGEVDGVQLPRDEILTNAFVLLPLSELAPDWVHPVTGQTLASHWTAYDKTRQHLWRVSF